MVALLTRRPQPIGALQIDYAHPLARGIYAGVILVGQHATMPIDINGHVATNQGTPTWAWTGEGLVLTGGGGFLWAGPQRLGTSYYATNLVCGHSFAFDGIGYGVAWGVNLSANVTSLLMQAGVGSSIAGRHATSDQSAQYDWASGLNVPTGRPLSVFGNAFDDTTQYVYSRRTIASQAITAEAPSLGASVSATATLGAHPAVGGETRRIIGTYAWALSWNRRLTFAEISSIEDDPFCFLIAPQARTRFGRRMPITGAGASTLAGVTASATGAETISGTAASTLAGCTGSASGAETDPGTSAGTLAGFTCSAAGAETFAGTAASTLAGFTCAATNVTRGGTATATVIQYHNATATVTQDA